ncbi:MAG: DUF1848 domain-containing protein [Clostridia bacterium]|nr:DUF1848 domain-containing protein [Clostridia bacterium]
MILSVSRRTDIPACYMPWFMNRLQAGFVMSRNPMNPGQVSRIALSPENVEAIVFWTKNPLPLLPYLPAISRMGYRCGVQYTITGYDRDVEPNLPGLSQRLAAFRELADMLGAERLRWRYDPILLSDRYTEAWHAEQFARLADGLAGCADTCVISFLDVYAKNRRTLKSAGLHTLNEDQMRAVGALLAAEADKRGVRLQTCAERIDLSEIGVQPGACLDSAWVSGIAGFPIRSVKDSGQRAECGCVPSVDVGQYNTCTNGCLYCYANFSPDSVWANASQHQTDSPLLTGRLAATDRLSERKSPALRDPDGEQLSLL